jgi:pantoate--beta-alanine ligase
MARIDYVAVADLTTLQPIDGQIQGDALIALAVFFGSTRLIDNTILRFVDGAPQFS